MSTELIIAIYEQDEGGARQALERIRRLDKAEDLTLKNTVIVVKKPDGRVEVEDTGEVDARHGAIFGAITGAIIGLIGGPVGAVAGAVAGAATGGVTASLYDTGISNETIQDIQKGLQPGSSALIAYMELDWVEEAVVQLRHEGATVTHETIDDNVFAALGRRGVD